MPEKNQQDPLNDMQQLKKDHKALELLCEKLTAENEKLSEKLFSLEWMLKTKHKATVDHVPEYGDITSLNRDGLIKNSIEQDQLHAIVSEYLDLLETSAAIYEKNGDYAMGIFSSGWCQMMDTASRRICTTDDNKKALACGKWLCHESCWNTSLLSMNEGKPVEMACHGGIHLYAVPVRANNQIIGALNFGFGSPPKDDAELKKLSEKYRIPLKELREQSAAYNDRPPFIIDYAKKRIQNSALFLGYLVELKQMEMAHGKSENLLRKVFEILPIGLWIADKTGKLMQGNPAGVAIWGAEPKVDQDEYGVFKARRLLSGEEILPEDWALVRTVNNGETIVDELLEIDAFDGKKKIILNYTAPVLDEQGNVEAAIVVNQDVTEQKHAEEAINRSLKEKEVLLSEIHHRVKNNMAIISSMITLQSQFFKRKAADIMLKDIRDRIESMALVHEMVYENQNFAEINAGELLKRLASHLQKIYQLKDKKISVQLRAEDIMLDMNNSVPFTLLVSEVMTNAFKHAFPDRNSGLVEVNLKKETKGYQLVIRDDGVGISNPEKLRQADSFGYTIIQGLASQLRAELSLTTPPDGGLRVEALIPEMSRGSVEKSSVKQT